MNQSIALGFTNPVGVVFDPPTGRMFVAEKRGKVLIHVDGTALPTPFIDLTDEVHNAGDKGLLGLALDPDFSTNQYVYLLYTVDPVFGQPDEPEDAIAFGRLTRYTANGNVADLESRLVLLGELAMGGFPSCSVTHSIGTVKFGNDGTLFVGGGDGAHPDFVDGGQNVTPNDSLCDSTFGPDQNIGALRSQSLPLARRKDPAHRSGDRSRLAVEPVLGRRSDVVRVSHLGQGAAQPLSLQSPAEHSGAGNDLRVRRGLDAMGRGERRLRRRELRLALLGRRRRAAELHERSHSPAPPARRFLPNR